MRPLRGAVELLVGHTDRVLGGKVKLGEADLEALSSDLFQLFRFFADKDLGEKGR
ncbi:hypothetical protein M885DRAFT_565005 [Pelagophyceae sp. CCMP2097]|nr:hypothetical protein M885DRAFT_565005 [Pelagophyceae sp. CCMP2097]